tara:strand:- start:260 stop:484 length:225 start_codon:yes stop_codon:yes gene_type:complete
MYTYVKDEVDVAIIMTRDEVHDLRYVLRGYMEDMHEDTPEFVQRVAFWHSILSSPVPDESWYEGTDEEDDDDVA